MDIFPAIDLKDGLCVRLTQGDFANATIYDADPIGQAQKFAAAGAKWLHVVDLDGAREGAMRQSDLITRLATETPLKIQAGGGIRSEATIEYLLSKGVTRVVIGSLAVTNMPLVKDWLRRYNPERIVLAFDVRFIKGVAEIQVQGWQNSSKQPLGATLDAYEGSGLRHILCTDVGRDGMLQGANNGLYEDIRKHWPHLNVLASGGISELDDVRALEKLGVAGAVIGKALYEGRIDLAAAVFEMSDAG